MKPPRASIFLFLAIVILLQSPTAHADFDAPIFLSQTPRTITNLLAKHDGGTALSTTEQTYLQDKLLQSPQLFSCDLHPRNLGLDIRQALLTYDDSLEELYGAAGTKALEAARTAARHAHATPLFGRVAVRYFPTKAGQQALSHLMQLSFDRSDYDICSYYAETWFEHPKTSIADETAVSVKAALCHVAANRSHLLEGVLQKIKGPWHDLETKALHDWIEDEGLRLRKAKIPPHLVKPVGTITGVSASRRSNFLILLQLRDDWKDLLPLYPPQLRDDFSALNLCEQAAWMYMSAPDIDETSLKSMFGFLATEFHHRYKQTEFETEPPSRQIRFYSTMLRELIPALRKSGQDKHLKAGPYGSLIETFGDQILLIDLTKDNALQHKGTYYRGFFDPKVEQSLKLPSGSIAVVKGGSFWLDENGDIGSVTVHKLLTHDIGPYNLRVKGELTFDGKNLISASYAEPFDIKLGTQRASVAGPVKLWESGNFEAALEVDSPKLYQILGECRATLFPRPKVDPEVRYNIVIAPNRTLEGIVNTGDPALTQPMQYLEFCMMNPETKKPELRSAAGRGFAWLTFDEQMRLIRLSSVDGVSLVYATEREFIPIYMKGCANLTMVLYPNGFPKYGCAIHGGYKMTKRDGSKITLPLPLGGSPEVPVHFSEEGYFLNAN